MRKNISCIYNKENLGSHEFLCPNRKIWLVKPLTACNLNCKYCYYEINTVLKNNKPLSTTELMSVFKDLQFSKNDYIFLSGGEFLLHPNCFEIAKYLRNEGFTILTTNGINIPKHEKLIREVDGVQVSLDSVKSDYHDKYRGEQQKTIEGILYLTEHLVNTNIIVVLSKKNIDEFPNILSFCIENKVNGIFIQLLWLPKEHVLYNELILNKRDSESFKKVKHSLLQAKNKLHVPQNFYLELLETAIVSTLDNYEVKNCFGMKCLLTIDPYGNINNCLPSNLIWSCEEYPTTEAAGYSFKNNVCGHFSNECLCFFGQLTMNYGAKRR